MNSSQVAEDSRSVAVVTTTINVPKFIEPLLRNADAHGHLNRVSVIVIGDRKTPPEAADYCRRVESDFDRPVSFLDLPAQYELMRPWPTMNLFLRENSIQRRNVGLIQAGIQGAEVLISVDDDNQVIDDDFIGYHSIVGTNPTLPTVSSASGWWNVCQRLSTSDNRRFYHRGYPKSRQTFGDEEFSVAERSGRIVANGGLWLGTPDVDATAHIEQPLDVKGMNDIAGQRVNAVALGTWCPFNSQNTAYDMHAFPALYLHVMHDWLRGYRLSRMDDIWQSYFLRVIADSLGHLVTYGPPLVHQDRNPHNILDDLGEELGGYRLTESLIRYLREFSSSLTTYDGQYEELTFFLREQAERDETLERPEREYFRQLTLGMAAWITVSRSIQATG